jgi:hypothetical protein
VAVPEYIVKLPMNLIYCAASDYKLNTFLVAAIVVVESGGGTHKTRFEPTYPYLYGVEKYAKILQITQETEKVHQMTSWGLMQVMGSTARWQGYEEDLPNLCRPTVGLRQGCLYLRQLVTKYGNVTDAIAAYNAGSPRKDSSGRYLNQGYVDKVEQIFRQLTV